MRYFVYLDSKPVLVRNDNQFPCADQCCRQAILCAFLNACAFKLNNLYVCSAKKTYKTISYVKCSSIVRNTVEKTLIIRLKEIITYYYYHWVLDANNKTEFMYFKPQFRVCIVDRYGQAECSSVSGIVN